MLPDEFFNYDACYCTKMHGEERIWRCKYGFKTSDEADDFLKDKVYPFLVVKNYSFLPILFKDFFIYKKISNDFNKKDKIFVHSEMEGTFFK